jgi:hypothetical protein
MKTITAEQFERIVPLFPRQRGNVRIDNLTFRTPNIIYLFGPLGYKAIFKMRYFKVNFIKIAWL